MTSPGSALVMYRIGGRSYPLRSVPNCRVCRSPYRLEVENSIVAGRVYSAIAQSLPEDAGLTARHIGDHYRNGHLPIEVAESRRILEHRAQQRGKDIESGLDTLINGITVAEEIVKRGYEAIQRGDLVPDMKDVLSAAKLLETFGYGDEGGPDQEAIVEAFMIYHETAAKYMDPQTFARFGRDLSTNPILKALVAKYDNAEIEGDVVADEDEDVVEAEVVEEESALGESDIGLDGSGEGEDSSIRKDPPTTEGALS